MKNKNNRFTRKQFLKTSAAATAGLSLGMSAKSYGNIIGANDHLRFAVAGLNGRGMALLNAIGELPNTAVTYVCDVDTRAMDKAADAVEENGGDRPASEKDFRRLVESGEVDAVALATPDHWHTPMTLMGLANGLHVYVEKPCSHNPAEGEMLVEAQQKYSDLVIQMGNQQRSAATSIEAIKDIRDGIIGEVYQGKAWYSNTRGSIGTGQRADVPEWLDWELWQGPAPRTAFKDNMVHYNWHWLWNWGTGEINNNGAHELDICRWALGVDYPVKVTSSGGRYHFDDDWEFYDTQIASYEFADGKMIAWEGRSCNGLPHHDRGRGATIHGTDGTILLDRGGYTAWNLDNEVIKELSEGGDNEAMGTVGGGDMTVTHMNNFAEGIREGGELNSPIDEGRKSVLLCHLGNIAQELGGAIKVDSETGRIKHNSRAQALWGRDYEPGWEPQV